MSKNKLPVSGGITGSMQPSVALMLQKAHEAEAVKAAAIETEAAIVLKPYDVITTITPHSWAHRLVEVNSKDIDTPTITKVGEAIFSLVGDLPTYTIKGKFEVSPDYKELLEYLSASGSVILEPGAEVIITGGEVTQNTGASAVTYSNSFFLAKMKEAFIVVESNEEVAHKAEVVEATEKAAQDIEVVVHPQATNVNVQAQPVETYLVRTGERLNIPTNQDSIDKLSQTGSITLMPGGILEVVGWKHHNQFQKEVVYTYESLLKMVQDGYNSGSNDAAAKAVKTEPTQVFLEDLPPCPLSPTLSPLAGDSDKYDGYHPNFPGSEYRGYWDTNGD